MMQAKPCMTREPKIRSVWGCGALWLAFAWSSSAAFDLSIYHTLSGATAVERGDRVPGGSRTIPLAATVAFDSRGAEPSMAAVLSNAVLEGGDPFVLTVRSASGVRLPDGRSRFTGDYLLDVEPSGTQYAFDWQFLPAADGSVLWNGQTGWTGGHLWQITISEVVLVPEPGTWTLILVGVAMLASQLRSRPRGGLT